MHAFISLALAPLLVLVAATVGLTDGELAQALRGEVPVRTETFTTPSGKSAGRGVGAIVVDRAINEVWARLSRYDDKAEYMPRIKSVQVLGRVGTRLRVHFVVDATLTTARYTGLFDLDEANHRIRWTLDDTATDNTVTAVDGGYDLFAVTPNQTLVVYRTFVDSGLSVPRSIQDYMARKSIPNLLHAIKSRVETDGAYRK